MVFTRAVLYILIGILDVVFVSGQNEPRTICKNLMADIVKIPTPPPGVTIKSVSILS